MAIGIDNDGANIPNVNLVDQGSDPTTPAAGHVRLYTKSGVLYVRLDDGTVVAVGSVPTLAEGQLAIGDASDELTALALGTEGQLVTADASGMAAWADAPASGGYTEGVRVRRSTDQTINNTMLTPIVFDTEIYDTDSCWEGVTNPSRLTAATAGKYIVTASLFWAAGTTGERHIYIKKNNTTDVAATVVPGNAVGQALTTSCLIDLAEGDYLELIAYQNRGSSLVVSAYSAWSPAFAMQRVG